MMTLQEALKEICHYTIWIDQDGKIHAIGEQPPHEVVERLERAGFGSGGDEWKGIRARDAASAWRGDVGRGRALGKDERGVKEPAGGIVLRSRSPALNFRTEL